MRLVAPALAPKLPRLPIPAIFLLKALLAGPSLDQRTVYTEMLVREMRLGLRQHSREKLTRHLLVQQSFPILAENSVVPDWLIHLQSHEPPEQQVVVHLLHQHPFAAHGVKDLKQHRPQQPLRWHRWPAGLRIQTLELLSHCSQNFVHALADRSQWVILWNSFLQRNVAEHSRLLLIVAPHKTIIA